MKQNVDYELTPSDKDDVWNVRILKGEFVETIFQFGAVAILEHTEQLSYSLDLISSPDEDLTVDNQDFQKYCGDVLMSVIADAIDRVNEVESTTEREYDENF